MSTHTELVADVVCIYTHVLYCHSCSVLTGGVTSGILLYITAERSIALFGADQLEQGMLLDCQPKSTAKSIVISMCFCSCISAHTEH